MSAHPTHILVCDGCQAEYRSHPVELRYTKAVRDLAAQSGWKYVVYPPSTDTGPHHFGTSCDFCASCTPAQPTRYSKYSGRGKSG